MTGPEAELSYPSLAVVVPIYNEAGTIEAACKAFMDVSHRYHGRSIVLAVDDGSDDKSGEILSRMASDNDALHLEPHPENRGYGAAVRTGASWAHANDFEYVAFIDSDLTNPPEDLLKIGLIASEGADYIKASRFVTDGGMEGVPFRRRIFSHVGNIVGARLFGIGVTDVTNGFRAIRTKLHHSWPLKEDGFAIIMEEVYWATLQGVPIAAFPTILKSREEGQRGSAFAYTPRTVREYLNYPVRSFWQRSRFARSRRFPR